MCVPLIALDGPMTDLALQKQAMCDIAIDRAKKLLKSAQEAAESST